jgi:hypothetical protein
MATVRFRLLPVVVLSALAVAGCAKLHARSGPVLETPAPPARVIPAAREPIEGQPIVAAPVGEVQAPTPAAIKPPETAAAPAPAPAAAAPQQPPPAAAEQRPVPPSPEPPPSLQTTTNPSAAEQRTRAALANAQRDLGRIDVRSLSADARAQYDIARRFVSQANAALNDRNFEFAQQLADKAATLAALLQRR